MSAVYTAREARTRFAELLRHVRGGEVVTVSYRGAPIAEMRSPIAEAPPPDRTPLRPLPTKKMGPHRVDFTSRDEMHRAFLSVTTP